MSETVIQGLERLDREINDRTFNLAIQRIANLQAESERLRDESRELIKERDEAVNSACDNRETFERVMEENERLREALLQITEVTAYDQPSAVQGWEDRGRIAREALRQEGG